MQCQVMKGKRAVCTAEGVDVTGHVTSNRSNGDPGRHCSQGEFQDHQGGDARSHNGQDAGQAAELQRPSQSRLGPSQQPR